MRKLLIEQCERLCIRDVQALIPTNAVSAVLQVGMQEIAVRGSFTNLKNGYRYHWLCPQCGCPHETLYRRDMGAWGCRVCLGLGYGSQLRRGAALV
ncbi:MAG: hypothetical protein V1784_10750 [bacterium]